MSYYDREGVRKIPYAEDSTRGDSLVQPITYKGDTLTQVWIDARMLATLSNWLDVRKIYPKFMSEVVRIPLEMLVEHLIKCKEVEMVEDTGEARRTLASRYRVNLNRGGRGVKNVLHNRVLSDQRIESMERGDSGSGQVHRGRGLSEEDLRRAVEIYNQLGEKTLEQHKQETIEAAKASGMIVEDEQPKPHMTQWEREEKEKEYLKSLNASPEGQVAFMKRQRGM